MFNNFTKNNNNNRTVKINKKMVVNMTQFLTNNERIELKQNLDNGKNIDAKMSAIVKRKLNAVNMQKLRITPLKMGFFNAIVNGDFDKKERLNLFDIFNKKPHSKKTIPTTNLEIEILSIKLYHGQFKVGVEHSLSGIFGQVDDTKKYFMAQISAKVYTGGVNQGITFRIYRNGKIHFSGGILDNNLKQPEQIRKYIVDTFTNREKILYSPIVYNNTTGQFDVNGSVNLPGVVKALRVSSKIDYEPELRAALRIDYLGSSLQIFTSGVVQILGARSAQEIRVAYERGKELMTQLYVMGIVTLSNTPVKGKGKTKAKAKAKAKARNVTFNESDTVKSVLEKLHFSGNGNVTMKTLCTGLKKKPPVSPVNNAISYDNKKNAVKIGKRLCTRYPKPELVAAAKRIGVVDIKATASKTEICEKIKTRVFGVFKVKNKPCLGYTRGQLIPLAVTLGITVTDSDTVETICQKIQNPPSTTNNLAPKAVPTAALNKRRLTNSAIRENLEILYGKKWMNTYKNVMPSLDDNVAEIKKRVDALDVKKNKSGLPFKKNVNAVKKISVRDWKLFRKQKLNNKLINNFSSELNNLLNANIKKNIKPNKTKFPKGTKVEEL